MNTILNQVNMIFIGTKFDGGFLFDMKKEENIIYYLHHYHHKNAQHIPWKKEIKIFDDHNNG